MASSLSPCAEREQCAGTRGADVSCRLPVPRRRRFIAPVHFQTPSMCPLTTTEMRASRVTSLSCKSRRQCAQPTRRPVHSRGVQVFRRAIEPPKERRGVVRLQFRRTGSAHAAGSKGECTVTIRPTKDETEPDATSSACATTVSRLPWSRCALSQRHSSLGPIGHFEDVRHHVVGARVGTIEGQRASAVRSAR